MTDPVEPSAPPFVWIDRNAIIHLISLTVGITTAALTGIWALAFLLPFGFFVITEVLYFARGIEVFSHANRVRRVYQWFDIYLDGAYGQGRDLTEALFDGDRTKPFAQALEDKFDKFIELLDLRPGDTLLDVGCGYGEFLAHVRKRGIVGRGITLSAHQAKVCRERGLDVVCVNYNAMPEAMFGQFDAVTFLGCLEHFGSYVTNRDRTVHDALLRQTYATAWRLLKPDSRVRRILSSTIHETKMQPKGIDWLHGYLIERHYSGLYPRGDEGLVKNSRTWFDELHRRDATEDYRLASELDPLHFGNFEIRWNAKRLAYIPMELFLDPFWLHKWLYHALGSWMWQFGGVGGLPKSERPVTLWWFVLQAKPVDAVHDPNPRSVG